MWWFRPLEKCREWAGGRQVLAPKQKKGIGGNGGPRTSAWKAIVLERGKKGPFPLPVFLYFLRDDDCVRPSNGDVVKTRNGILPS